MFAQAINKFQELSTSDAYKPDGFKSVGGGQLVEPHTPFTSIENVWSWSPSDCEEITVVKLPEVGYSYVIYQKFFNSSVGGMEATTQTFLCDSQRSLDKCFETITCNFLI